ncbi:hypothetical protein [Phormidesmis priestleyi]|uniref:hypothetical protein n=1 Tax=Phormidesmis priestleyi TaxID=268141 RepID=UPI000A74A519|nr:hypothetical protein [Phormidesmis priestleyi]
MEPTIAQQPESVQQNQQMISADNQLDALENDRGATARNAVIFAAIWHFSDRAAR